MAPECYLLAASSEWNILTVSSGLKRCYNKTEVMENPRESNMNLLSLTTHKRFKKDKCIPPGYETSRTV